MRDRDGHTCEFAQPAHMNPRAYLAQYYEGEVDTGNRALLRFYSRIYQDLAGASLLEFGGGPTIYSLITAARTAGEIHFCDYHPACLREVQLWLSGNSSAFDWSHFTRYALSCENGMMNVDDQAVQQRHALIRQRVRYLSRCDIWADDPLLGSSRAPYGVVANTFCLDSITSDRETWLSLNQQLARLLDEHGCFVTVSLLNAVSWTVKGVTYPAVTLTPTDVRTMYATLGFTLTTCDVIELAGKIGYDGFIMACGERSHQELRL